MSENTGTDHQCFFNIFWQNELISQKAMVFMPVFSSPKEKPPIPEKISNTATGFVMIHSVLLLLFFYSNYTIDPDL